MNERSRSRAVTARTLLWATGILAAVGAMVGSPSGGILILAVATLLAAPVLFLGGRARWIGAAALVVSLGLAAARLPDARREMDRYTARAGEP